MADHPVIAAYASAASASAVQLAAALAAGLDRPLVLASAYTYRPAALSARPTGPASNYAEYDAAEGRLRGARLLVPDGVEVEERPLAAGSIADALDDLAREEDATLIVAGADEDGRVTRTLLARGSCPVAVARPGHAVPRVLREIAVAYDGSPAADRAVTAAMHIAARHGARVTVLAAEGPGADAGGPADTAARAAASIAETVPSAVLRPPGDDPAAALVGVAGAFDLLVCGSRGRGPLTARVLGSVSERLVTQAPCPVLVVPARAAHRVAGPLGLTTAAAAG